MKKSLLIHPEELSRKWIDRMYENGVQILALHPTGGETAHESLSAMLERLESPEYRVLLDYAAELGMEIEYEFHAASFLLPRELFRQHPEYFRVNREGERTPHLNFCISEPEALNLAVERAVLLSEKLYRSALRYHFWLDDARDAKCFCPKCRTLSASDQQLLVVNAVVKALREKKPGASLSYLAYFEALQPPETVQPEPGIFLEYAPFDRDMKKSAADIPEAETENILALLRFFGKDTAQVLEYWYDNSMFSHWKKPPQPFSADQEMVRQDIRWYRELGFADISAFACFLGADYEELYGEPDITGFKV